MTGHAGTPDDHRRPPADHLFTDPQSGAAHSDQLAEGATWLLDLVSAVDHLRRGLRHQFTVWDALEEALRAWVVEYRAEQTSVNGQASGRDDLPWDARDPLAATLADMLEILAVEPHLDARVVLQQAVRRWVLDLAVVANDGACWPHPRPRRSFPPVRLSLLDDLDDPHTV